MVPAVQNRLDVKQLVLAPAIVSLVITILRLVGEMSHWSPSLFGRAAGGGGSLIGISWLVPVFGIYFAVKLVRQGQGPASSLKSIGLAVVGAAVAIAIIMPFALRGPLDPLAILTTTLGSVVGVALQRFAWPELFRTLLAYAFAARIPVAIVMLAAIIGDWGTHYDVAPDESFPAMGALAKWFYIGAIYQFTFWIMFTVVIGTLFGGITALVMRAPPRATTP